MDHLAILKKSRKLAKKILSGEKTIESRWYKFKRYPWNKIKKGEIIYFKDSGDPVTFKAEVEQVLQFENLNLEKIKELVEKYSKAICLSENKDKEFWKYFDDKNYCILIFLKNVQKIKPFSIDKTGYGLMSAWICVENIKSILKS
ncbi:ASCH domain-containing protein [Candidatus Woesearchaeota archaeon]|nr:ASCH domain-containing protein [Candidatus Woesearchaeota archaeon]